jgi:hypothetical protein
MRGVTPGMAGMAGKAWARGEIKDIARRLRKAKLKFKLTNLVGQTRS